MGGGDLNMKKSWHPLLMKNQERVWKEERKAIEERKKTIQLQKELAEERQLQELQRLHAAQAGGSREDRLEWLYATPASGTGLNLEEQEAYLLGKKTVDKLFKEKDEAAAKLAANAASHADPDKPGHGFISLQNANSARDIANKIRQDPLLAIKQQEQLAYENLKKNPARLKALQAKTMSKEDRHRQKEERKREKKERRDHKRERDSDHHSVQRRPDFKHPRLNNSSRSPDSSHHQYRCSSPSRHDRRSYPSISPRPRPRSPSRSPSGTRSFDRHRASPPSRSGSHRFRDLSPRRHRLAQAGPEHDSRPGNGSFERPSVPHHGSDRHRPLDSPLRSHHGSNSRPADRHDEPASRRDLSSKMSESKAAKLAQMEAAAKSLHQSRAERLRQLETQDNKRLKEEEAERERNRIKSGGIGDGTRAKFVREQESKVFFGEMALAERVQRSGGVGLLKNQE